MKQAGMSPTVLGTYFLRQMARTARNEFESESSIRFFDTVRGMLKMKYLQALMD